jgi:fibronectin type 3 domain-containing protein
MMTRNPQRLLVLIAFLIVSLASCHKKYQDHAVTLTWQPSPSTPEATVVGYNVYRRTTPETPYVRIATRVPGPPYEDRMVSGQTTYTYAVTAVDAHGRESRFSDLVRVDVR